jgi:nicotinate-nucleotide pyrophosphorylase (carboxylating)
MLDLSPDVIRDIVNYALREDIGQGDLTTLAVIPPEARIESHIIIREDGVVAGLPVLATAFSGVSPDVTTVPRVAEGSPVQAGDVLAIVSGSARGVLSAERVALNLFQRMCGIATLTARYVAAIAGTKAHILDTRKTTPGLRALEKYAVRVGGGHNHRFGLYDGIMLKDNHLAVLASYGIDMPTAVHQARAAAGPMVSIEVEVETLATAIAAAEAGADLILLDNMPPDEMAAAVKAIAGRSMLEASGGITLETVRAAAESGVDFISIGALTHSARALDIGLDMHVV